MQDKTDSYIKRLAIKFDRLLAEGGVGLALFFIMLELIYINSKSLYEIDTAKSILSLIFAIVGSIAFSITTIVVLRKPNHKWLKRIVPLFDVILVFLGLNLSTWDTMLEYPLHLTLSIFFALFTGLITFSLGQINYEEHVVNESIKGLEIDELQLKHDEEFNLLKNTIKQKETDIMLLSENVQILKDTNKKLKDSSKSNSESYAKANNNLISLQSKLEDRNSQIDSLKTERNNLTGEFSLIKEKAKSLEVSLNDLKEDVKIKDFRLNEMRKYEKVYLLSERSRILKKKEDNRTELEKKLLDDVELYLNK